MKKCIVLLFIITLLYGCKTTGSQNLEYVSWEDLADKSMLEENDNRYVTFKIQYLGLNSLAMPSQELYPGIDDVILLNHISLDSSDLNSEATPSLNTFFIGLPEDHKTDTLILNTKLGKTIEIIGKTELIMGKNGIFSSLLIRVESYKVIE